MAETLASGYSSESALRELSNEYQHDRVLVVFKDLCILVLWTKIASALEGLKGIKLHEDGRLDAEDDARCPVELS